MASYNRFSLGEVYHCYNRGVDKRITFENRSDYQRFIQLLYICNNEKLIQRSSLYKLNHVDVFSLPKSKQIVSIGAYSLMPNHFHLLLQETREGGISLFMSRLGNSYTKYFNIKNKRNGNLFVKPFHSKHIKTDQHFSHIVQYIHINPAELSEPRLKEGLVSDVVRLENSLKNYPHSSLPDYYNIDRPEKTILDKNFTKLLSEDLQPLLNTLKDSMEYYSDFDPSGQETRLF